MKTVYDTPQHLELKRKSVLFLVQMGCLSIETEYKIGQGKNGYAFRADVAGIKDGKLIVVECGGTSMWKLNKLLPFVGELYILPHGQDKPFKWNANMVICQGCGNLKGVVGAGYERNPRSHKALNIYG